jgi:hypothetical protein
LGYSNSSAFGVVRCGLIEPLQNKRAKGWFFKIGNDIKVFHKISTGPILIYNNYNSSALNDTTIIQNIGQTTFYAGLSMRLHLLNKPKWGLDLSGASVLPLQKEQFLGASCNERKIGAGSPPGLYMNIEVLVYIKL